MVKKCSYDVIFDGILAKNKIAKTMGLIENRPRIAGTAIEVSDFDWLEQRLKEIELALDCAAVLNEKGNWDRQWSNQSTVEEERKHGWKY
jgi:hypothetical protein